MKNLLIALVLTCMTSVAFAQYRPGPRPMPGPHYPGPSHGGPHYPGPHYPGPGPRPYPGPYYPQPYPHPQPTGYSCRVAMIDRYGRPVRTFFGTTDYNGMCRNALNDCNWEQRRMGAWDLRCVQAY
jgi:hypothetical protein